MRERHAASTRSACACVQSMWCLSSLWEPTKETNNACGIEKSLRLLGVPSRAPWFITVLQG